MLCGISLIDVLAGCPSRRPGANIVWVKRDDGNIFVGFAFLNLPQQSVIAYKLENPTRPVADDRLNPTYDLSLLKSSRLGRGTIPNITFN